MRAGWILLKIRHKQYGVNVDDVGLDAHIEPQEGLRLRCSKCNAGGWYPPLRCYFAQ